jgi:isopentenyl-diphosphate delta-isomerase
VTEDLLIIVDEQDRPIEPSAKSRCHEGDGVLHRAFSVYLFDVRGWLLLQKRSERKRLWPGHWANSCCSHPRWGEETLDAAQRRVTEELGVEAALERIFSFRYHAQFDDRGAEHELCHVLIGNCAAAVHPDPHEVADWTFVPPERLDTELASRPEQYAPWLPIAWRKLRREHWDRVEKL